MSMLALVGSVTLMLPERTFKTLVLPMVSLAAGSLPGGALFHMLPEAIDEVGNRLPVYVWLCAGILSFFVLEQYLPLLQRPAGAAGSGQSAPLGVQAHQGVGHGGPPRHMRARGASRPVFTPAFSPAFLSLSPHRIMAATPSPERSPRRRPPAATRRGAGQI
jgi:hypothetical protein